MLPTLRCELDTALATTHGEQLTITTGPVQRVWQWTGHGFATVRFADAKGTRVYAGPATGCDWQLPESDDTPPGAELVTLEAHVSDDEGFTREHVAVVAVVAYPEARLELRYTIWAYPGAPGFRTHLAARAMGGAAFDRPNLSQGGPPTGNVDRLPGLDPAHARRFFGYYNETQTRNDTHQHIIKEETVTHPLMGREWCDWASAACVEDAQGGIALVKESHKCVNQPGYVTGGFTVDDTAGLACHGWGLRLMDVKPDVFTDGWATWSLLWLSPDGQGDVARETAFKRFDQLRYPIDPARDIYIQANTWGSTDNGSDARRAAGPESVVQEIDVCAEMGIDILQIDDGWQVPLGHHTFNPAPGPWLPHPETYPDGWQPIRDHAAARGVKLGLWAAAVPVSLEELQANYEQGGFVQFKLDFAELRGRQKIDDLMQKVRAFIQSTGHKVRVNWDVTENPARYGYFFAREYGPIYLENRKPRRPLGVVYRPHTVLRDLWQLARYLPLHRIQGSIQNVDMVDPTRSDAHLHSHGYATAIALMSIPLFFLETKYYSDAAKAEIKALLDIYKQHRERIYRGTVYPIGDCPDNASWTGFQCHLADENAGYLTVFRERCNDEPEKAIRLRVFIPGTIKLTDLVSGATWEQEIGKDGAVIIACGSQPGYNFFLYGY